MSAVLHTDPMTAVIFSSTLLLILGLCGRYLAKRFHQPGVLGELLMGIVAGNLCYGLGVPLAIVLRESTAIFQLLPQMLQQMSLQDAIATVLPDPHAAQQLLSVLTGPEGSEWIKVTYMVDMFSRYGIIFLLFMVGLESSLASLKQTGAASLRVACVGVLAPLGLGLLALYVVMPQLSFSSILFIAATLSATSVGITARTLKDMHQLQTREAKTILGAAMIDDMLGLLLLAIVSGIVLTGKVDLLQMLILMGWAVAFLGVAIGLGPLFLRYIIRGLAFTEPWEAKLLATMIFVMTLAWLAAKVQLATMIGAFVAGLIMHEAFFVSRESPALCIKQLIAPFEAIYAPLFFLLIGWQVKLETLFHGPILALALLLIIVAIVGKLLSGAVAARQDDRWLIGIGMLPRGEVGLVFAAMGKTMGVIPDDLFSALIAMVMVTTFIAPPWLKRRQRVRS